MRRRRYGPAAAGPRLCRQALFWVQRIDPHTEALKDVRRGVSDPLADRQHRRRPGQHRACGQREYDDQSVPHTAWVSGVGHLSQPLQQARDLLGYGLRMLAELVHGRRDRR
jgi:hypothetical protein